MVSSGDVDSGEGCPVDDTEATSVELNLNIGEGIQPINAVFEVRDAASTVEAYELGIPLGK